MSAGLAPTIHASAALVDGTGVLVRGPSGSGKSALVLALILADSARNRLVADDRTVLAGEAGRLVASPPEALAGLIELRGYGILRLPYVAAQEIGLVVDLEEAAAVPRMPERSTNHAALLGIEIPRLVLPIGHSDGAVRVRAVLLAGCRTVNDG
ncbi:HPr kinase/phosphatase C-terminal domain-containing protein [Kaistia geumhonensis]|uniref:Serine kinase of HPr protein (Carbohydrate metabolism regulator) n=1 Tax=Kaistia geumhonensis TaxID=410839 RepID=A0ABU0M7G4_9HYPH|nr:HPr kinase/phosphatase C-terminal domain-containing protein [Kaistia geumhonensis]MCX5477883.1 HPr kinase/phosphatase C-terminal domain-containing protein [Kaistia geumhonensis]MDQ0516904.1 serine kinase of HPr protein (carbohydrate metabolism regulator) [Kaistia geumhonensis]